MTYQEFKTLFEKQVYSLKADKQLDFAILICKRLFGDYVNFTDIYKWGNTDVLLDAISFCDRGRMTPPEKEKIVQYQSAVDSITPDMDDFGDEMASYALNACVAVYYTLQFLADNDPVNIIHIGTTLTDTIDFRIQENEDLTEEQIENHPLMKATRDFLLQQTKPA